MESLALDGNLKPSNWASSSGEWMWREKREVWELSIGDSKLLQSGGWRGTCKGDGNRTASKVGGKSRKYCHFQIKWSILKRRKWSAGLNTDDNSNKMNSENWLFSLMVWRSLATSAKAVSVEWWDQCPGSGEKEGEESETINIKNFLRWLYPKLEARDDSDWMWHSFCPLSPKFKIVSLVTPKTL